MAADFTTWCPSIPLGGNRKLRVRAAQFGDGYQQRTLDGINALDMSFDVVFENRPSAEIVAMDNYLGSTKGDAFRFKHPVTKAIYLVVCDEWNIEWPNGPKTYRGINTFTGSLSATFTRLYGVTV